MPGGPGYPQAAGCRVEGVSSGARPGLSSICPGGPRVSGPATQLSEPDSQSELGARDTPTQRVFEALRDGAPESSEWGFGRRVTCSGEIVTGPWGPLGA